MSQDTGVNWEIKIEHGIPFPIGGKGSASSIRETIKAMEVGDSILVTERQRQACFAAANDFKMKLTSRLVEGNLVRVWRIK